MRARINVPTFLGATPCDADRALAVHHADRATLVPAWRWAHDTSKRRGGDANGGGPLGDFGALEGPKPG